MSSRASGMALPERLFWLSVAIYVAVLPVSSTIALRNLAFAFMIGVTLWAMARHELRLQFVAGPAWAVYAAVALLSLVWAVDPGYSFAQVRTEIGYGAIVFAIAASWGGDIVRLRRLARIAAACNVFMVCYSGYLAAVNPHGNGELIGSFGVATGTYSTYLITVAPLLLFLALDALRSKRMTAGWTYVALMAVNIMAMWFTGNRQGVLVYGVEIAVIGGVELSRAFSWRRLFLVVSLAAAFAALFLAQQHKRHGGALPEMTSQIGALSQDVRLQLWNYCAVRISENPWHGAGFGREAFLKTNAEYAHKHPQLWHAHNMLINKGIQMGVPGALAFLVLWGGLAGSVWWARRGDPVVMACAVALLAGVFLKNMTDDFFVEDNALMFWLFLGPLLAALRRSAVDRNR